LSKRHRESNCEFLVSFFWYSEITPTILSLIQFNTKIPPRSFSILNGGAARNRTPAPPCSSPATGSIFEIDTKTTKNKKGDTVHVFNRLFIAFKPCIDGFLEGCRPYVGVDATFLSGKYTGELAAAIGVDGHSWMFPVAFGIF
jgi:hypothetical protein